VLLRGICPSGRERRPWNVWKERVPLFLCVNGFVAGNDFFSEIRFEVDPEFDREKFIRDAEDFMVACEEEARRIDGDRDFPISCTGFTALRI